MDLLALPPRDGAPDDDGVLAPVPGCCYCGGKGRIEWGPERGMGPGELNSGSDPCGCAEPPGFSDWFEELLAEISDARSLRQLARVLVLRGDALRSSLDHLETLRRRGVLPSTDPPSRGLWESDPLQDPVD